MKSSAAMDQRLHNTAAATRFRSERRLSPMLNPHRSVTRAPEIFEPAASAHRIAHASSRQPLGSVKKRYDPTNAARLKAMTIESVDAWALMPHQQVLKATVAKTRLRTAWEIARPETNRANR